MSKMFLRATTTDHFSGLLQCIDNVVKFLTFEILKI